LTSRRSHWRASAKNCGILPDVFEIIGRCAPYMNRDPSTIPAVLKRLRRRLAIGLFLEIWPAWTIASLIAAGTIVVACRMFVASAAPYLIWLWLLPVLTAIPALVICVRRAYAPTDVAAIADWLGGGRGALLTWFETTDPAWSETPLIQHAATFPLPRIRLRLAQTAVIPALVFLAVAFLLPQRVRALDANAALADEIASDLKAAVVELKQNALITPEEEQRLDEQIERIRQGAQERVDPSSWEAADALREEVVAGLTEKQEAVKWAQESLARLAAAADALGSGESLSNAQTAELTKALEKLSKTGLLAGAPENLKGMLQAGKMPTDPKALRDLAAALGKYLAETNGKFTNAAGLGKEFGRFDPSEFQTGAGSSPDGDVPGNGGINRGRGDAELTWGKETTPFDRYKSKPLPPGAARSPDDWAPIVSLPGAPQVSPAVSAQGAARDYAAAAGQAAWRRSLAPRHQTAVKKYFAKDKEK
jgi:hypothetical protein